MITHLNRHSSGVISAAQALQQQPNDPAKRKALQSKITELEVAVDRLKNAISLSNTVWPALSKVQLTTHYIASQVIFFF
jgi:hypothetical protein